MPRKRTIWIAIADGSRARIVVRREEGSGFDIVSEMSSAEANVPSREIWADRPGRTQESGYSGRHAVEPRHDPHQERKAAFIRGFAAQLNEAAEQERFDELILFAAPRSLAELRGSLEEGTQRKLKAAVAKDLTKLPLSELARHLEALDQT